MSATFHVPDSAQNVWNHPQWVDDTLNGGISTDYGASNFGTVTSAYDP